MESEVTVVVLVTAQEGPAVAAVGLVVQLVDFPELLLVAVATHPAVATSPLPSACSTGSLEHLLDFQ